MNSAQSPVRHLDLATPAFTTTVRTPSVTTLSGEKNRPNSLSLTSPKTDMKGVTPISRDFREGFASATDSESWRLSQVGPY